MIEIKDLKEIKKGDIFYERGFADWYKLEALEDGYDNKDIEFEGKIYKQSQIKIKSEFGEEYFVILTQGLKMFEGKYYK